MEKTFYTKSSDDLSIMDLINLGIIVCFSLRNSIFFIFLFFFLYGFLSTSTIKPNYHSNSRLLIEMQNINLKDEQNIDFSSLNNQSIQTEIEKIYSNTLLHNVILENNIEIPSFELSRENSSFIVVVADRLLSYSGLKILIEFFSKTSSSVTQKAIEKTLDVTLDTIVNSVSGGNESL